MEQKQALAERLKQANNILVTVSSNPSVDQLAACIGMTLALNKLEKHATAVFSGAIPNIIEFLEPEKTLEKNTDSLRDFIIALDKSKADKLRYKVEDTVVKIFITPYRTSINEKDLEFSQGDFNVDVVLALGVHNQADLDTAITSHGRILHDATVATVNVEPGGELGTVNWIDHDASSLSELAAELVDALNKETMDTQIATAFLTGIVAETDRFSNDKTSPMTMTISAELMAAGANQQLVATKLEPPAPKPESQPQPIQEHVDTNSGEQHDDQQSQPAQPPKPDDGTLEISHEGVPQKPQNKPADEHQPEATPEVERPSEPQSIEEHHDETPQARPFEAPFEAKPAPETESTPELEKPAQSEETNVPQIKIDEQGSLQMHDNLPEPGPKPEIHMDRQHMILQPPALNGGQMGGSMLPEDDERPAGEPPLSSMPSQPGLLQRGSSSATASFPPASAPFVPPSPVASMNPNPVQTMANPFASVQPPTPPAPVSPPQPTPITPTVPQQAVPAPSVFQQAPISQPNSGMPSAFSLAPTQLPPLAPVSPPTPVQTLSQLEQNVNSPHLQQFMASPAPAQASAFPPIPSTLPPAPTPPAPVSPPPTLPPAPVFNPVAPQSATTPIAETELDSARDAVMNAYEGSEQFKEPIEALNAQPLGVPLHESDPNATQPASQDPGTPPPMPPPMVPPAPGV